MRCGAYDVLITIRAFLFRGLNQRRCRPDHGHFLILFFAEQGGGVECGIGGGARGTIGGHFFILLFAEQGEGLSAASAGVLGGRLVGLHRQTFSLFDFSLLSRPRAGLATV